MWAAGGPVHPAGCDEVFVRQRPDHLSTNEEVFVVPRNTLDGPRGRVKDAPRRLNSAPGRRSTSVPDPFESSWWVAVASQFTLERLDEMERVLVPLVGPEASVMRPQVPARHAALVAQIEGLPWRTNPAGATDAACTVLVATIDVTDREGDVPWGRALVRLADHPRIASKLARAWWGHWAGVHLDTLRPVAMDVLAMAAYAMAVTDGLLLIDREARAYDVFVWAETAAKLTEFERRVGLDLVLVVRAARLFQPLLKQTRRARPRT